VDFNQPFAELCQVVHRQIAAVTEHQFAALADIQSWTELPWNARLFSTLVVFQNYLISEDGWRFGDARLENLHAPARANYPLTLVFQPGPDFHVTITAQARVTGEGELRSMAAALCSFLERASISAQSPVGELARQISPLDRPAAQSLAPTRAPQDFANLNERVIAEIWQDALGCIPAATDNFFDLGGHSLLMLQVHRRLCAKVQRDISIVTLFQFPTIRSLATHLAGGSTPVSATSAAQERAAKARAAMARQATKSPRK
jgi:hypothetical protein